MEYGICDEARRDAPRLLSRRPPRDRHCYWSTREWLWFGLRLRHGFQQPFHAAGRKRCDHHISQRPRPRYRRRLGEGPGKVQRVCLLISKRKEHRRRTLLARVFTIQVDEI